MKDTDLEIERITGSGPGGQHRNKTASCIRLTHKPTGIQVTIDGRNQHANLRKAKKLMVQRLAEAKDSARAKDRKARRDAAIKDSPVIRTYDYKRKVVKDHRSGKVAPLKDVLAGYLEGLR